jgi:hypothetical protein
VQSARASLDLTPGGHVLGRKLFLDAFFAAVGILDHSSAWASPITIGESQAWLYDGTANGCSACTATAQFELLSGTSLKITFENTSTDWLAGVNLLTGIGFNAGGLTDLSILSQGIEGGKVWKLSGGIGGGNWEVALASMNGINNGLDNQSDQYDSGWIILGWNAPAMGLAGLTIENTTAKFQGTAPTGGANHAPGSLANSTLQTNSPVAVPEPSLLVFFTAAAAIAGSRYRRQFAARRKQVI